MVHLDCGPTIHDYAPQYPRVQFLCSQPVLFVVDPPGVEHHPPVSWHLVQLGETGKCIYFGTKKKNLSIMSENRFPILWHVMQKKKCTFTDHSGVIMPGKSSHSLSHLSITWENVRGKLNCRYYSTVSGMEVMLWNSLHALSFQKNNKIWTKTLRTMR